MGSSKEEPTSTNYGSFGVIGVDQESSSSFAAEREEGGDTFDSNAVSMPSPPSTAALPRDGVILPRGGVITPLAPDRRGNDRSIFDAWIRRDFSVKNNLRSSGTSFTDRSGSGSGSSMMESFLGPTNHSVEDLIRSKGGLGLGYKSLDRSIVDTAIWHRRKVGLIEDRRRSSMNHKTVSNFQEKGEEFEFDVSAVSRLESERGWMEWALVVSIGACMAVIGILVSRTADELLDRKLESSLKWLEYDANDQTPSHFWYYGLAQHVLTSAVLALLAFAPVAFCPVSGGSGIAEAKAVLNGVVIENCTSLTTALCKAISVICAVAASLPAGLEGPMIFMGLSIGENASRLVPQGKPAFDLLRTDRHRIDFAAIGTAAGVTAAFRSPISGVLFAMEEGSSFWSTNLTWRCFLASCATTISMYSIFAILPRQGVGHPTFHVTSMALFNGIDDSSFDNLNSNSSNQNNLINPDFDLWEYVVFGLLGAGGGLIGAMFCSANRSLALLRRRLSLNTFHKGLEVLCIATITAILTWVLPLLPYVSICGDIESRRLGPSYYRQFDCADGQYNELATLLLNPLGARGITLLFTEDGLDAFSAKTCLAAGLTHLVILCIAFGMSVSAGIFIPLLFIGACLGRAIACICNNIIFGHVDIVNLDPRTYAIIGAAATLGGVVRVLISLTSIVTHTTSLSFFMTPVMVATLLARTVGNYVSGRPGIYDIILQLRGVPFLEEECPVGARHANIRARNVMSKGIVTLGTQVKVNELVDTLRRHAYSDFPVVDNGDEGEDGALVGLISRVDLLALLSQEQMFFTKYEKDQGIGGGFGINRVASIEETTLSYSELDMARPKRPFPTGDDIGSNLTPDEEQKYLHLSPYMQIAPITVQAHGSAERAYEIFRSMGLRLMLVVDKRSRPIGVITRHQLALLEEIGLHEHKIEKRKHQSFVYSNMSEFKTHFE